MVAWICGALITLYIVGTTVHIAQTGRYVLHLAPNLQYNAHWIVEIYPIAAQISSPECWSLIMRNCNCIVYLGTTVHKDSTGGCAVCLSPYLQYNAHWIVDIPTMAAQIRSVEYWSLNMRSCWYLVYVRDHSSHSVNWTICAVFDTKFAV
jgi:hypothetical protein